jgi:hypothetical protein
MTAKQKIETLTNSWYGYVVFTSAVALLESGLHISSILGTAAGALFNLFLVWYLGRKLLHKSSLTRVVLVILSGITTVLGVIGTAKLGWVFLHEWSLSLLVGIFFGGASVVMNARSFRVLTDSQVKAYFG